MNTVDLNLLKVFDALYREQNVSRAGERIGLAQSSMSNALNRLRQQFEDPLFQRTPQGMVPTARADQLAPQVKQALALVEGMLTPPVFDPAQAQASIAIATSDLGVMTLAPGLLAALSRQAPGVRLHFVPLDKQRVFADLDSGTVQFAIGTFNNVPAHLHRKVLRQEHFVCIARQQHPALGAGLDSVPLSLKAYCSLSHVLMTLNADQSGVMDKALKRLGRQRHVAMTCAQFSPIPAIIASSDLIATVPASLTSAALQAGCQVYPLPVELDNWQTELIYTQRGQTQALNQFLIELIQQTARPVSGG